MPMCVCVCMLLDSEISKSAYAHTFLCMTNLQFNGRLDSMERWIGMERWNGIVEWWNGGIVEWWNELLNF